MNFVRLFLSNLIAELILSSLSMKFLFWKSLVALVHILHVNFDLFNLLLYPCERLED